MYLKYTYDNCGYSHLSGYPGFGLRGHGSGQSTFMGAWSDKDMLDHAIYMATLNFNKIDSRGYNMSPGHPEYCWDIEKLQKKILEDIILL